MNIFETNAKYTPKFVRNKLIQFNENSMYHESRSRLPC